MRGGGVVCSGSGVVPRPHPNIQTFNVQQLSACQSRRGFKLNITRITQVTRATDPSWCIDIAESAEREARLLNTLQSSHLVVRALGSRFISIAIVADFARAQAWVFALLFKFDAGWVLDQEYTMWHEH